MVECRVQECTEMISPHTSEVAAKKVEEAGSCGVGTRKRRQRWRAGVVTPAGDRTKEKVPMVVQKVEGKTKD
ncbi:unnamed protein product [Cuscuta campestris]|uniref:Uncharacterized protein n=1 Tax=Cuscuta campestris TaxID=132261 RepID=A0A484NJT4_9ASTE|nr:unnamed protein product [Cuscuta campestris]